MTYVLISPCVHYKLRPDFPIREEFSRYVVPERTKCDIAECMIKHMS